MTFPGINVVVPHTLSREIAFQRVLTRLGDQKDGGSFVSVKPGKVTVDFPALKATAELTITLLGHAESHTLTFASEPGQVHVTSDPADSLIERGEFVAEAAQLKAMLGEALK